MNKLLEIISKVFNWIPNKQEYYRNKIEKIKREMDKLQKEGLNSDSTVNKYMRLTVQLRDIRKKAENT